VILSAVQSIGATVNGTFNGVANALQ